MYKRQLLVHIPARFAPRRTGALASVVDLLPALVELADGQVDPRLPLEDRSLLSHLRDGGGHDEVIGEYTAEGTLNPLMMIRRGDYKFIYSEQDPCPFCDLCNDPQKRKNLATSPTHRGTFKVFLDETQQRWGIPTITHTVLNSRRRRRLVVATLARGRLAS